MSALGDSLVALRSFNLVITVVLLVVTYRCLTTLGNHRRHAVWLALLACWLIACNPFQVRLAGEVRMYPLLALFTVASSWALGHAITGRAGYRGWLVYAILALAAMYTHYFGLFLVASQLILTAAIAVWRPAKAGEQMAEQPLLFRGLAVGVGGVALGWAAWLPVFMRQRERVGEGWWIHKFHSGDVVHVSGECLIFSEAIQAVPDLGWLSVLITAAVLGAAIWRGGIAGRTMAALALVCGAASVAASWLGTNLMVARYFAGVQIVWLTALAAVIARLPTQRMRREVSVAVVLLFVTIHGLALWSSDVFNRPGIRAALDYWQQTRRGSEHMYTDTSFVYFPASFHADRRQWLRLVDSADGIAYYAGGPVIQRSDRIARSDFAAVTADRIWWLSEGQWPAQGLPAGWRIVDQQTFYGTAPFQHVVRLTCLARR